MKFVADYLDAVAYLKPAKVWWIVDKPAPCYLFVVFVVFFSFNVLVRLSCLFTSTFVFHTSIQVHFLPSSILYSHIDVLMANYRLHTAQSRPDLWEFLQDPTHPLNAAWPAFLDQDQYFQHYCSQLENVEAFAFSQFAIFEVNAHGEELIIASGRSVPFYWPELDAIGCKKGLRRHPEILQTLPEEGYDGILVRAFHQHFAREGIFQDTDGLRRFSDPAQRRAESPNALPAISITVCPEYRSQGLAETLILAMKQTAMDRGFDAMVVPLRPTRKAEFPVIDMPTYVSWEDSCDCGPSIPTERRGIKLPFDPWLRKHVRLGAQVAKVASQSMFIQGDLEEWEQWTGIDIEQHVRRKGVVIKQDKKSGGLFIEVAFPRGLVPLRYYFQEQRCVYIEPNVWLHHELPVSASA